MEKPSSQMTIAFLLIFALILVAIKNNRDIYKLKKQLKRQSVVASFEMRSLNNNNSPFDSTYFKADTAFFYKAGKLVGKSITVEN